MPRERLSLEGDVMLEMMSQLVQRMDRLESTRGPSKGQGLGQHGFRNRGAQPQVHHIQKGLIVSPSSSYYVEGLVGNHPAQVLINMGTGLTLVCMDYWNYTVMGAQQLQPVDQCLVGVDRTPLSTHGWVKFFCSSYVCGCHHHSHHFGD